MTTGSRRDWHLNKSIRRTPIKEWGDHSRHQSTVWRRRVCHSPWTDCIVFLSTIRRSSFHQMASMRRLLSIRPSWRTQRCIVFRKSPYWVWSINITSQSWPWSIVQSRDQPQVLAPLFRSIKLVTTEPIELQHKLMHMDMRKNWMLMSSNKSFPIHRMYRVVSARLDQCTCRVLRSVPHSQVRFTKPLEQMITKQRLTSKDLGSTPRTLE